MYPKTFKKSLRKIVIMVTYLILEASRENKADRVQDSLDLLQSAVILDVTFSSLHDKLADSAVLARLSRLVDLHLRAAQAELSAKNGGSLLLEQKLNQRLTFLGNEVMALFKGIINKLFSNEVVY